MVDIVSGLFGLSPYETMQQQQNQIDKSAANFAQMNAAQRGSMGLFQGGAGLAREAGGMLGLQNPQVAEAQARQAALQGLDISSPESILQRAQQVQDPKLKMQLMMLADQKKKDLLAAQATSTKMALELAQAQKALRENPNLAVTEVGVKGKPGYMQRVLFDKTNPTAEYQEIGEPYLSAAAAKQTFHVSTGEGKVRSQVVTDNEGNSTLVDLNTGAVIKNLGKIGKPSSTFEKVEEAKKSTLRGIGDAESSINQLLGTENAPGLLYKATGSGIGAGVDLLARGVGYATKGDIANAKIQPLADAVLKIVPRFEGPQSDKDTASYKEAAGNLANASLPIKLRIEAAKTIKDIYARRKSQFVSKDYETTPTQASTYDADKEARYQAWKAQQQGVK
jgi:hypothetical protein